MKKALQVLFLFVVVSVSTNFAQAIFVEEFDYSATAADSLKAHGWILSGSNNTNPFMVTTPGLTYTGYPSVKGNATSYKNFGQDIYKAFSPAITSGSAYLSFLINVQAASSIGDYFLALSPASSQTNYYARLHIKSQGTNWQLGISKSNELSGGNVYATKLLNYNTTYLVVVKHTLVAGTMNDEEKVFIFSSGIQATEPTATDITLVETTKNDPADLGIITLRQGGTASGGVITNEGPVLKLDGIRIATSWSSLLIATDIEENAIPTKYALNQNYPNPFNPSTVINYQLPEAGQVTLKVYDVLGNEVTTLVNEFKQAGVYNAKFSNSQLSSGIYFYKLQVGNFVSVKKMMLTK